MELTKLTKYDMFKLLTDNSKGYVGEFLDTFEAASATGYTGLTPAAVTDSAEADSYNSLYSYPKQNDEKKDENRHD